MALEFQGDKSAEQTWAANMENDTLTGKVVGKIRDGVKDKVIDVLKTAGIALMLG